MKFLGVDLGWSSGASGLCCLCWQADRLELLALDRLLKMEEILAWIDFHAPDPEPAIVAVDAPTLIPNATGMRLPDRLAHKHFGRYHAGCYPANLGRPFAKRTVEFGLSLEARGFQHAATITPQKRDRYQIESFPHAAMVHLFQLERILKYKKGLLADRRTGLTQLRQCIIEYLPQLEPCLDLQHSPLALPDIPTTGVALKAVEDQLDSLICAYIAAHWWYWGLERNWVLGDRQAGYIVVPNPHQREMKDEG
jgi:predicted RNase H-like nuclease